MEIACRKWGKFGKGVPFVFHLCSCLWLDKRKHLELEVYVVCAHRCKKEDVFSPSPYNQFPCQDVTRKLNLKSFLPGTQHKMCGWVGVQLVGWVCGRINGNRDEFSTRCVPHCMSLLYMCKYVCIQKSMVYLYQSVYE